MFDLNESRELIGLASDPPDLTPEEEYEFYKKYAIRTRKDLEEEISTLRTHLMTTEGKRSEAFYKKLDELFELFYKEVKAHLLIEPLDNWWGYAVEVRETGISLLLEHYMVLYEYLGKTFSEWWRYKDSHNLAPDDGYELLQTRAPLLTLEEYGKLYGVEGGTVRQWIRRGKIRSAFKAGNEWRIPAIADKPRKDHIDGHYKWEEEIPNPPPMIPDLNEYKTLYLYKNKEKGKWAVKLESEYRYRKSRWLELDTKEKEKLEVYLISHPMIECVNNCIGFVYKKKDS